MGNTVKENLSQILKEIEPSQPRIIAITKYFDETKLIEAYEAGLRDFGENRVMDALEKFSRLPKEIVENSTFHLVGHLQTNKVKKAVGNFDYIHSVDSLKLARVISNIACQLNKRERILLQVNNAGEEQKFGYGKEELLKDMSELLKLDSIDIVGLMNMAPIGATESELACIFSDLRKFRDRLTTRLSTR